MKEQMRPDRELRFNTVSHAQPLKQFSQTAVVIAGNPPEAAFCAQSAAQLLELASNTGQIRSPMDDVSAAG